MNKKIFRAFLFTSFGFIILSAFLLDGGQALGTLTTLISYVIVTALIIKIPLLSDTTKGIIIACLWSTAVYVVPAVFENRAMNYTYKSNVAYSLFTANEAKQAIAQYYMNQGKWPENNQEAGVKFQCNHVVKSIHIKKSGQILMTLTQVVKDNGVIILTPNVDHSSDQPHIDWQCATSSDDRTAIPLSYLPSNCRNSIDI